MQKFVGWTPHPPSSRGSGVATSGSATVRCALLELVRRGRSGRCCCHAEWPLLIALQASAKLSIMNDGFSVVEIGALSDKQFTKLRQLRVSKRQEVLGKSFLESIEDWELAPRKQVLGLCFVIHESPVGLVLFRRQAAPDYQKISVHGLKIALPWQQQGYGHQAFRHAVQYVRAVWPDSKLLSLAVDAENKPAVAVYRNYGMSDSGPVFDGPNGKEHHMDFSLRT